MTLTMMTMKIILFILVIYVKRTFELEVRDRSSAFFKQEPDANYIIELYENYKTWKDSQMAAESSSSFSSTNKNEIRTTTSSIVLDCQVQSGASGRWSKLDQEDDGYDEDDLSLVPYDRSKASTSPTNKVKWFKNDLLIDFDRRVAGTSPDEEINRELLSNGSLKLTYSLISEANIDGGSKKPLNSTTQFYLTSKFKCLIEDTFGKLISRPAHVYRLRVHSNDLTFKLNGAKHELNGKFLKQPDNTTLIAGKRLLLRCRPNLTVYIRNLDEKNANQIKYEWFRDNRNIQPSTKTNVYKDGSLEIIQASESDSGFYKCIAKFRSLTFESRQAYVKVVNKSSLPTSTQSTTVYAVEAKAVPKFYLWPEDKNIRLNEEIVLECLAANDMSVHADLSQNASESSQPQYFKYKWLKNGIALDFKNRDLKYKLVQGFNLKIENATESDTGTYTCRICNWNSNKTPVKKSMYVDANDGKSTDTLDSNEERDECDERSAFMNVLVPPRFVKQPSPLVNATLKSDVELECSVYGVPMPQVQWFKNGEPLYSSEYFQFNPTQGTLKILGIIAQDEGYYQCVATNELNTIQTITQLVVQLDEDYQQNDDYYDASDSKLPLGRNKPQHQSNNKPSLSTPRSAPIIHLSAPAQLKLIRARSRSVTIEWQAPPIMSKSKPTDDETLYYSINWKAKNMPRQRELNTTNTTLVIDELTPETVYLVQVSAILASTRSPTANLEFKTEPERATPSRPVDFRAELLDLSPPIIDSSAPATSNRVLKLKWKRPVQNWQSIVKYRIFYQHMYFGPFNKSQQNKSDEFQPVEDESPSLDDDYAYVDSLDHPRGEKYVDVDVDSAAADTYTHEFSLDELLKYSTYKFRLVALDAYAMSRKNITENAANEESNQVEEKEEEEEEVENSVELTVETPSDVPDAPPEDIQVETLNTSSIQVNWNLPAVEKRNGIIIGYKIAIKENDKQVWNSNVDAEPRRKIISGLLAGHKYSFRLTARTANGSGPASDWHIAETFTHEMDESRVPGQPVEIFTEPTDKSIIVHWSPPSDSNITVVRKYLLKFGIGFPITEVELAGNRNSYIINNLTPSSQYVISLKAGNNIGYGMEILKDVITKRKSALSDSENLFPPLNVQAVAISPQSIEVKWTDWHLKPEETIPDDRYYTIRYCVTDASKEMYKFKNSTERNAIVSDLAPNTMYDFSVKLIIGRRESDWSMTTSQMTMETSPAPRSIKIASDPSAPSSVIISWMAPKVASNNGYVISYIDEAAYKENGNKWKMEHVSAANAKQDIIEHRIKKLKLETIYYFKIQSRNNRAYSVSSPTIIFKTPNAKGKGGGKIYTPNDDATGRLNDSESRVPIVVLNRENQSIFGKNHIEMNMVWIIITSVSSLFALVFILFVVFMCNRSMQSSKQKGQANERLVYERNGIVGSSRMMPGKHKSGSSGNDSAQVGGLDVCMDDLEQQQQLLSKADLIMQSQMLTHLSCSNSSTTNSTLIKQQHSQRTPSHNHHHNQPLMISNPNHMMMNVLNQPLTNNSQTITDVEFYSNVNTTGHLHHGFHHHHHHGHHVMSDAGSCYNNNSNNNGNCNSANNEFSYQSPHCGNDQHSQIADDLISNNSATATSAAIAAANLAFSSSNNATSVNEPMFLRHTIRPKPIAIPISTNNSTQLDHQQQQHHTQQSMFGHSSNVTRKSLKNLPIATATLIPSNVQTNSNQSTTTTSKLHYTARPYIIDNQVQSNCEYSNHSPASSSHSGCGAMVNGATNQQLYDKLGNINAPNSSNASTKSLLQPLKSFANANANHGGSNQLNGPNSSLSIPNTPAKYCDNLTNMTRSPAKKQLLVSLAVNTGAPSTTTTTTSTASSLNGHNNHHMMGKSVEDIYDKVTDHQKMGNLTSEELTAEMANLEGIMKDLNAITAQQFEC